MTVWQSSGLYGVAEESCYFSQYVQYLILDRSRGINSSQGYQQLYQKMQGFQHVNLKIVAFGGIICCNKWNGTTYKKTALLSTPILVLWYYTNVT